MSRFPLKAGAVTAVLILALQSPALAHVGFHPQGIADGIAHPFSGLDHILAMVAVGLWASQLGRPAWWLLPAHVSHRDGARRGARVCRRDAALDRNRYRRVGAGAGRGDRVCRDPIGRRQRCAGRGVRRGSRLCARRGTAGRNLTARLRARLRRRDPRAACNRPQRRDAGEPRGRRGSPCGPPARRLRASALRCWSVCKEAAWPTPPSKPPSSRRSWRRNSPPRRRRPIPAGCAPRGSTSSARTTWRTSTPWSSSRGRGAAAPASTSITRRRAHPMTATCARFRPARRSSRSASCSRR